MGMSTTYFEPKLPHESRSCRKRRRQGKGSSARAITARAWCAMMVAADEARPTQPRNTLKPSERARVTRDQPPCSSRGSPRSKHSGWSAHLVPKEVLDCDKVDHGREGAMHCELRVPARPLDDGLTAGAHAPVPSKLARRGVALVSAQQGKSVVALCAAASTISHRDKGRDAPSAATI
jgi:hypothetical protein